MGGVMRGIQKMRNDEKQKEYKSIAKKLDTLFKKHDCIKGLFVLYDDGTAISTKTMRDLKSMIFSMETEVLVHRNQFIKQAENNFIESLNKNKENPTKRNPLVG